MADIEVTATTPFGSADPVRWDAFCNDCQQGRSFGSEEDLNIWLASHEERHG